MIKRVMLYLEYRRTGLRDAWGIAGMRPVATSTAIYIAIVVVAIALWLFAASEVRAIEVSAMLSADETVASSKAEIESLRKIVAACVGEKDGLIRIGNDLYLCGIAHIGAAR